MKIDRREALKVGVGALGTSVPYSYLVEQPTRGTTRKVIASPLHPKVHYTANGTVIEGLNDGYQELVGFNLLAPVLIINCSYIIFDKCSVWVLHETAQSKAEGSYVPTNYLQQTLALGTEDEWIPLRWIKLINSRGMSTKNMTWLNRTVKMKDVWEV